MGSGSKRKSSDEVIVQPRESKKTVRGGGGMGGGGLDSGYSKKAAKCPAKFTVKLRGDKSIIVGSKLSLKMNGAKLGIYFHNQLIINLTPVKAKIISECINLGFKYNGLVVAGKGGLYAEFKRGAG